MLIKLIKLILKSREWNSKEPADVPNLWILKVIYFNLRNT